MHTVSVGLSLSNNLSCHLDYCHLWRNWQKMWINVDKHDEKTRNLRLIIVVVFVYRMEAKKRSWLPGMWRCDVAIFVSLCSTIRLYSSFTVSNISNIAFFFPPFWMNREKKKNWVWNPRLIIEYRMTKAWSFKCMRMIWIWVNVRDYEKKWASFKKISIFASKRVVNSMETKIKKKLILNWIGFGSMSTSQMILWCSPDKNYASFFRQMRWKQEAYR